MSTYQPQNKFSACAQVFFYSGLVDSKAIKYKGLKHHFPLLCMVEKSRNHKLQVSENQMLRKLCGNNRDGGGRKFKTMKSKL
jgi:hypothetical protein